MRNTKIILLLSLAAALIMGSCGKKDAAKPAAQEDKTAKQMLQGIWVDPDAEDVAFMAKGDTIFYPDSTSQPVFFMIVGDSLVMRGSQTNSYAIVKQTPHNFTFKNQNGETVHLVKSDDPADKDYFVRKSPVTLSLNQGKLIKRDSVAEYSGERYHSYVQVNPTTYKVVKATYNDDGVEVDNVYYDNIIHLSVFRGAVSIYSHDFHKADFTVVPKDYLSQAILSDMTFGNADQEGLHFTTYLIIPDTSLNYLVDVLIDYKGRMRMSVRK